MCVIWFLVVLTFNCLVLCVNYYLHTWPRGTLFDQAAAECGVAAVTDCSHVAFIAKQRYQASHWIFATASAGVRFSVNILKIM